MVGLFGIIVIKTNSMISYFKEQLTITVFLKDSAKKNDVAIFRAELKKAPYSKTVSYVSKEDAAKNFSEDLGEDFLSFLGDNPLKNAVDIKLNSDYVQLDSIQNIEKNMWIRSIVEDVVFDKPLIELLVKNFNKLIVWLLVFSGIFTIIAIVLINNAIRLSVYSKRFTLKTMQMVGATKKFIRMPFVRKGIFLGISGALIAITALFFFMNYLNESIPELDLLSDNKYLIILSGSILGLGILISWVSTYFATQRFLNLRAEQLH
jgi:cell division transport system permease protein